MPISTSDLSVALFVRGLTQAKVLLHKAEQHTVRHALAAEELLGAKLASDMHDLAAQLHWAAEGAKLTLTRLVGAVPEPSTQVATTFTALHAQLDATIAQLQTFADDDVEAGFAREIEIEFPRGRLQFTGARFLVQFAIPTFYFHLTNAYAILRHRGIDVGKGDFLGLRG